jgi:hypothetical protein
VATLPDGTTVDLKHSEGFEVEPLAIGTISLTAGTDTVKTGDTFGLSGVSELENGNRSTADLVQRAPDENETVVEETEGSFSISITAPSSAGEYEYFLRNSVVGSQHTDGFNLDPFNPSHQHTEGFNS